jgi:hypothetical protein
MPGFTKEQKKKNRLNRVLQRFMDRREFALAAVAAGLVTSCEGQQPEKKAAEPEKPKTEPVKTTVDYTHVINITYLTVMAASGKEATVDPDHANDPYYIPPMDTDEKNIKHGREWFKWRIQKYFKDQVDKGYWPDQADYVLFNAARMGGEVRDAVGLFGKAEPKHMKKGFEFVKKDPKHPDDKLDDKNQIKIFDMWCNN